MRNLILIMLVSTMNLFASTTYSQQAKFSMEFNNSTLKEILEEIKDNSEFTVLYKSQDVRDVKNLSADFENATVVEILEECLNNTDLGYDIEEKVIVIFEKELQELPESNVQEGIRVHGQVKDKNGVLLPGVSVIIKGTYSGTSTNLNGVFNMLVPKGSTLTFSFVGMASQEVLINDEEVLEIVMTEDATQLADVVVNGYFVTKKESFTGTATVVKGEELRNMGTQNVMKSLSLMDPSLNLLDNNEFGSDPNQMPEIRLRGEAVMETPGVNGIERSDLQGDPNAPLFIMDDFQTTIEKVMDLDMNRVESVTILKDASATAIYGSRAANGVIVIRTKQPEAGKLQVSYNLDTDFSFPDLTDYDLLNAKELFQLQQDLDYYDFINKDPGKAFYIEKLIASGVDTDWLAQPTRNAVGQKHSLNLMGGDKNMRYMFDINYADKPGVMKDSDRKTYGIATTLQYNLNDKIIFRNRLDVSKNKSKDSPYGSFDTYAKMPSYFPIHDSYGNLILNYDGEYGTFPMYNPIHEAQVGNLGESSYTNITNNFGIEWNMHQNWRLRANVSYTSNTNESESFVSPYSQQYEETVFTGTIDPTSKGRYSYTNTKTESVDASATLNFSKDFNGHFVSANVGLNMTTNTGRSYGFAATGFTTDEPDPAFAKGYEEGGLPTSSESKSRLVGALANLNYTYQNKYLFDASYRLDGSSQFGSEDKTAGFYSVGIGWNIHKESFLKNSSIVSLLKLRATYGETGSVNFSPYQAKTILNYYTDSRYWGNQGTYIKGLGNENLKWQTTENKEFGVDFGFFNSKLTGNFSAYRKTTTDMVTTITTPPSVGFTGFKDNLGEMENKGYEISVRGNVLSTDKFRWSIYASASHNESKLLSIGNAFESYNDLSNNSGMSEDDKASDSVDKNGETLASHNFLVKFEEGESNTAIWAVRSLGIDPMTGKELFLTRDGETTFEWNGADKVIVGDTEPTLRGTFGTSLAYKGFDLGLTFRYEFGGQAYNNTLVDKVENSNKLYNVDRRVLTDTWRQPGDVVKYIARRYNYTPASSRFVQDNDLIELSSINLNYSVPASFAKKLSMQSLRFSFNMSDIFYYSTIKRERGTSYPFARSFTLGLRANF
nr:SusC/RagA family TonB-linked outer membrane protein [uncultured Marinifilum sp.]